MNFVNLENSSKYDFNIFSFFNECISSFYTERVFEIFNQVLKLQKKIMFINYIITYFKLKKID